MPDRTNKRKTIIIKSKEINPDILRKAIHNLTNNRGFMVWSYLIAEQEEGYLSSKNAEAACGISINLFRAGVRELIDKGYLNWVENNTWEFISEAQI